MRSKVRGTRANIDAQHTKAFPEGVIDAIKALARSFYEHKRKREAAA